jgi:phage N-6-adenine-methyltransferase
MNARVMPKQRPGKSVQDVQTEPALMKAVHERFGAPDFDLAASRENTQSPAFYSKRDNSLVREWHKLHGLLWLNPPFSDLEPWAKKCAAESAKGARILLLTPASVGSNWFGEHVLPNALVLALAPRVTFVGHANCYPKDVILSYFHAGVRGFDVWRWK